jgi:hypothetical protein
MSSNGVLYRQYLHRRRRLTVFEGDGCVGSWELGVVMMDDGCVPGSP